MEFLSGHRNLTFFISYSLYIQLSTLYKHILTWLEWNSGAGLDPGQQQPSLGLAYLFSNEIIIDRDLMTDDESSKYTFCIGLKLSRFYKFPVELHHGRGDSKETLKIRRRLLRDDGVPFKKRGKKVRAKRLKDDRRRPKEISKPEQGKQNRDTLIL